MRISLSPQLSLSRPSFSSTLEKPRPSHSSSSESLARLVALQEEGIVMQRKSMAWQAEMIERQNAMGLGSGIRFWWNRLLTNGSVALPLGFVSGAVTGAVLPFFAKLMGGIT
jgi:hypothetical protein